MGTSTTIASTVGLAVLTLVATGMMKTSPATTPDSGRQIVVAELFTSEGCSSCPPADSLLQHIASASPVDGVEVLGLEEHVDYWDRLGWRDPFSSPIFTNRQAEYASRVFRSGQIYTPQLVVDGAFESIGSDEAAVRAAIAAAAARSAARVHVSATPTIHGAHIEVAVEIPIALGRQGSADVLVGIVEEGLTTHVERGENRGRTLPHSAVVRALNAIGTVSPGSSHGAATGDVPLAPEWSTSHLRVVAFVQDHGTLEIFGAGVSPLARQHDK